MRSAKWSGCFFAMKEVYPKDDTRTRGGANLFRLCGIIFLDSGLVAAYLDRCQSIQKLPSASSV
jgi:hypothetical protein